ncbi:MAG: twin transmembrane helix small protein [Hyphomicrobiaceae bacterium]
MSGVLVHLTTLIALAVVGVLGAGLWNLARPSSSPSLSQKLMRWRVGLQFIAILVAMLALAVMRPV